MITQTTDRRQKLRRLFWNWHHTDPRGRRAIPSDNRRQNDGRRSEADRRTPQTDREWLIYMTSFGVGKRRTPNSDRRGRSITQEKPMADKPFDLDKAKTGATMYQHGDPKKRHYKFLARTAGGMVVGLQCNTIQDLIGHTHESNWRMCSVKHTKYTAVCTYSSPPRCGSGRLYDTPAECQAKIYNHPARWAVAKVEWEE